MRTSWVGVAMAVAAGVVGLPTGAQAVDVPTEVQISTPVTVQQDVTVAAPVSVSVQVNGQPAGAAAARAERRAARHQK